ncbi:hypothetical protein BH09MYX1_BH09MYX1_34420 [soil metagenome]
MVYAPSMLNRLRGALHTAISTPRGDAFAPVRVSKDALRRLNVTLGYPVASTDELGKRAEAAARLVTLRQTKQTAAKTKVQAPIVVYMEKNRNDRLLGRVVEVLAAKSYAHTVLDVAGDAATMSFVTQKAGCKDDDLPVVFVGDVCIGGFEALVAADVSGALEKAAFPA